MFVERILPETRAIDFFSQDESDYFRNEALELPKKRQLDLTFVKGARIDYTMDMILLVLALCLLLKLLLVWALSVA